MDTDMQRKRKSLNDFLRNRGISEETITLLQNKEIDSDVIANMDVTQLEQFIPKWGDRFALLDFCKRGNKESEKDSLVQKLRTAIGKHQNKNTRRTSKYVLSSSDDEASPSKIAEVTSHPTPTGKSTRQIEIGWFCSTDGDRPVQMKTLRQGGGTRKVSVPKNSKRDYILERGKNLFFPNGILTKGPAINFSFDLWDSKRITVTNEYSVEEIYQQTGICRLRFYIASTQKTATVVKVSGDETETASTQQTTTALTVSSTNPENASYFSNTELIQMLSTEAAQSEDTEISYEFVVGEIFKEQADAPANTSFEAQNASHEDMYHIQSPPRNDDVIHLQLHRVHVMNEMIEAFKSIELTQNIHVEMILPNGVKENAEDIGGVLRDCLSEFWTYFYDTCTNGTTYRIPTLRHDFTHNWIPIAKILHKGWTTAKYFPIRLCAPFMEHCLYGQVQSQLEDWFLKTIPETDKIILEKARTNFNDVDHEELIDVLSSLNCKQLVTERSFEQVLQEIAHKEVIQESKFIIDQWYLVLKDLMPLQTLQSIYNSCQLTAKIVTSLLVAEDGVISSQSIQTFDYSKKFLRESTPDRLRSFLRFCTGADMVTTQQITVTFDTNSGFSRTPVGHTCGCVLELPNTYSTYPMLRTEFNSLLDSDIWVMDIV